MLHIPTAMLGVAGENSTNIDSEDFSKFLISDHDSSDPLVLPQAYTSNAVISFFKVEHRFRYQVQQENT